METSTSCSTHLCIYWLVLVCALTRNPTCNLVFWEDTRNNWATQPRHDFYLNLLFLRILSKKKYRNVLNTTRKLFLKKKIGKNSKFYMMNIFPEQKKVDCKTWTTVSSILCHLLLCSHFLANWIVLKHLLQSSQFIICKYLNMYEF